MTLRAGMLGIREGPKVDGERMVETGKWTAIDSDGDIVGTGVFGANDSDLGYRVKEDGSYGIYPFEIDTDEAFEVLVLEATQFGHGEGYSVDHPDYGENSSDFALNGVEYTRLDTGSDTSDAMLSELLPVTEILSDEEAYTEASDQEEDTVIIDLLI